MPQRMNAAQRAALAALKVVLTNQSGTDPAKVDVVASDDPKDDGVIATWGTNGYARIAIDTRGRLTRKHSYADLEALEAWVRDWNRSR